MKELTETELLKIHAEISYLMAQTAKANKETRWYEVVIIVSVTLATVAFAKLFV